MHIKPRVFFTLLVPLALFSLLLIASLSLYSSAHSQLLLRILFLRPYPNGTWLVKIEYSGVLLSRNCSGLLAPNPYYVETKGISKQLVVAPLYYILDSVCGDAASIVEVLSGYRGNLTVAIVAPRGFGVRSSLDWRGFGGLGGPYRLPAQLFARFYVYDSLVVYSKKRFNVYDGDGLSVVYQRGVNQSLAGLAWRIVSCVSRYVAVELGASPRRPVVVVLVAGDVHPLYPPGFAFSTGGVVYLKLGGGLDWVVHTLAHEALHGWLNYDLLGGGFGFEEAAAEFLALRALRNCNESLYRLAYRYHLAMKNVGEDYAVWSELHERLWRAGLAACGQDVYTATLRYLFSKALAEGGLRVNLFEFTEAMVEHAPPACRRRLEALLGPVYPGWSPSLAVHESTGGNGCGAAKTVTTKTVTVTVTKTAEKTVVATRAENRLSEGTGCPCIPGYVYFVVALASAFAGAAAYAVASKSVRAAIGG